MSGPLPAVSLVAVPSRRRRTVELAQEIERRGFSGIWCPSIFGNMSLCEALAWNTSHIKFGTAIAPIYTRSVLDFAQTAAFLHEIAGGRFHLGIGIAHAPAYVRLGITPGKPLTDTRGFLAKLRAEEGLASVAPLPAGTGLGVAPGCPPGWRVTNTATAASTAAVSAPVPRTRTPATQRRPMANRYMVRTTVTLSRHMAMTSGAKACDAAR